MIRDYLKMPKAELKMPEGAVPGNGPVVEGQLSVEEARVRAAALVKWRKGEVYGCVGDYDPVLRAHCRLDREG